MIQALDNSQCRSFPTEHYLDMVGESTENSMTYSGTDTSDAPSIGVRRDYYVYARYLWTGEICYIGKGSGTRLNDGPQRQPRVLAELMQDGYVNWEGKKLYADLTEPEAYALEKELIAKHKRKSDGGTLVNESIGGPGRSGYRKPVSERGKIRFNTGRIYRPLSPEHVAALKLAFADPEVRKRKSESAKLAHAAKKQAYLQRRFPKDNYAV